MNRYEENFKQMIVDLNQTGRSVRGLAKEYGLSEATIYKWKNLYLPNQSTGLTGKEVLEVISYWFVNGSLRAGRNCSGGKCP